MNYSTEPSWRSIATTKNKTQKNVKILKIELYAQKRRCYVPLAKLKIIKNVAIAVFLFLQVRIQITLVLSTAT